MICIAIQGNGKQCKNKVKYDCGVCGKHIKSTSNNNFGQDIKARAGTSRNGFNNTFAKNNCKEITPEEISERDKILKIIPNMCMYCKIKPKEANDHLIPQCRTQNSIYGQNNSLNKVPSCNSCNGSKGGKVDDEFRVWLKDKCNWSGKEISDLFDWIDYKRSYLYLDEKKCDYLNKQHKHINKFHNSCQKACINDEDIITTFIRDMANDTNYTNNLKFYRNILDEAILKTQELQE